MSQSWAIPVEMCLKVILTLVSMDTAGNTISLNKRNPSGDLE